MLASYASKLSLLPGQFVSSVIPTKAKFYELLLSRWLWVGGLVGMVKLKLMLNSAQLELELKTSSQNVRESLGTSFNS